MVLWGWPKSPRFSKKIYKKTHRSSGLLISEFALEKLFRYLINFAGVTRQNRFLRNHDFWVTPMYKCDNYYNEEADAGIIFDDNDLGIDWQIDLSKAIISEKDKNLSTFKEFEKNNDFVYGEVWL